jgi:hypothetical protein
LPERQLNRFSALGLGSLGVRNFVSVGISVRGLIGSEMETSLVLVTDRRGLGDKRPEHHTRYREPRYD